MITGIVSRQEDEETRTTTISMTKGIDWFVITME